MSTSTKTISQTPCPQCQAALATPSSSSGTWIRCAACHHHFPLNHQQSMEIRTSPKATASLGLGLASLFGSVLTGLPAVLLGISALRDIRNNAQQLRGTTLAMVGILAGSIFSFVGLCVIGIVAAVALFIATFEQTEDPNQINAIAQTISEFDLPPGFYPVEATKFEFGIILIVYRNFTDDHPPDQPRTWIRLLRFPPTKTDDQEMIEARMRSEIRVGYQLEDPPARQMIFEVNGQPLSVDYSFGTDPQSGKQYQEYFGVRWDRRGPLAIAVVVHQGDQVGQAPAQADLKVETLSESQIREFYESFQ